MSHLSEDAVVDREQQDPGRARIVLRLVAIAAATLVAALATAVALAPSESTVVLTALSGRW